MTYTSSFTAVLVSLALALPASARDLIFGLSPYQDRGAVQAQVEQMLLHAATHLQSGETALFFDVANVRLLGSFVVPSGKNSDNPRTRLQANRALIGALKPFVNGAEPVPGRVAQIDLPGFLRTLRGSYAKGDAAVIVIGSPIADDPRAPSVSMRGARVPGDGHIAATAGQTPYGTAGLPASLDSMDLFFGLVGEDWVVSPAHAFSVERFWTLSAEAHGVQMAYFGDDLATLFRLAAGEVPDRIDPEPLVSTDKLEMLTFAPDNGSVPALYQAAPEDAPAPAPIWQNASSVTIGATWDQNVDVDLYVRPSPSADVIFYANAATPAGRLFKDVTIRPGTAFETVSLQGAIDLSSMQIALNFYGGSAVSSGVTGELRIAVDAQVWATPFHIPATRGNKGVGAETALVAQTIPNDAWVLMDPLRVVGAE
ncbi:hypothetical protein [uncultured Tateyamaria sp.]|uniref:hypothetical protein n=1 Tax=uncultured Tateyamaria sp. TaxID=455651 RepID=UPI00260F46DD|nr:hypothetical protein [uncultured Tateyamaria sp.]